MAVFRLKITKRAVDAARIPIVGEARIWDTEVRGFVLRIYPSGRKVYALKCRVGRRQHIHTVGLHGSPWTPDQARAAAAEALRRAKNGEDPSAPKKAAREALTVGGLIDRYLADGPTAKLAKRASTWKIDAANLNRHVRPICGGKVVNAVAKADATRTVRDIALGKTATDEKTRARGRARVTGGEATARRTAAVASAMFTWGIEHRLVGRIRSPASSSTVRRFANASCRRTRREGSWIRSRTFRTNSHCPRRSLMPSASCFSPERARLKFLGCDGRRLTSFEKFWFSRPRERKRAARRASGASLIPACP